MSLKFISHVFVQVAYIFTLLSNYNNIVLIYRMFIVLQCSGAILSQICFLRCNDIRRMQANSCNNGNVVTSYGKSKPTMILL
jgi:hypothetical protein